MSGFDHYMPSDAEIQREFDLDSSTAVQREEE
jgi:hypothetical protein